MKKLLFCTFLLIASCGITIGQTLYKIEQNGLYGYVDSVGNEVIEPIYNFAFTDTLLHIAVVTSGKDIIGLNNQGEKLFKVFNFDNGPDYVSEGLFRIVDDSNLIGYADTLGNIVIAPKYKFAYPFKEGKAKVALKGRSKKTDEYRYWKSKYWFNIKNPMVK